MITLRQAFAIVVSYAVAVVATPFLVLLTQSIFLAARGQDAGGMFQDLLSFIVMGAMITGMYAALPFLCAIGLLRYLKQRAWWAHSLLGMPVSAAALALFGSWIPALEQIPYWVAGLGSGLIYWFCRRAFGWWGEAPVAVTP